MQRHRRIGKTYLGNMCHDPYCSGLMCFRQTCGDSQFVDTFNMKKILIAVLIPTPGFQNLYRPSTRTGVMLYHIMTPRHSL